MEAGLKQFLTLMFNWSLILMVQIMTYEPGGLAALLTRLHSSRSRPRPRPRPRPKNLVLRPRHLTSLLYEDYIIIAVYVVYNGKQLLANMLVIELGQFLSEDFNDKVERGLPHDLFNCLLVRQWQIK